MDVKNTRAIRTAAQEALAVHTNPKRIALVYVGLSAALSLAVTVICYVLGSKIDQMTGLSNMGNRAIFSTVKSVLPIAQLVFLMGWEPGYHACTLRFARRRYVDLSDLKAGFPKFGAILRTTLLMGVVYVALSFITMYAASFIFMSLPISNAFYEVMAPLLDSATVLNNGIVLDEATAMAAAATMWPAFVIFAVLFIAAAIPVSYTFRMVPYCLVDNSQRSAMAILKESRIMMRGNRMNLFKLDLSFWWFFLLEFLLTVLCYLDLILPLCGIVLPFPSTVTYYGFYIFSLAGRVALSWAYLNRVFVSRACFYDAIRPQTPNQGVTLGNIFDLAKDYQE